MEQMTADTLQSNPNPIAANLLQLSDATVADSQLTLPVLARRCKVVSAWPNDLVKRVKAVVSSTCKRPKNLEFKFKLTWEAVNQNAEVLKTYCFNLGTAINANHDNPLGYRSKFQPAMPCNLYSISIQIGFDGRIF
jgi:hypothetical protein